MWSISELMGVPEADRRRLYELSHSLIDDQDPEVAPTPETSMEASIEIYGYASEMAARERANPSGSLTSDLLAAEVDGRKLTDLEFTLFFMFLIVAGNETTRTATSHGLLDAARPPRRARTPGRRPGADAGRGRGDAALASRRSTTSAALPPPTSSSAARRSMRATRC